MIGFVMFGYFKRTYINLAVQSGLEQKLLDLKVKTSEGKDYPWEYFLDITSDDRINVKNIHDDLKRETLM